MSSNNKWGKYMALILARSSGQSIIINKNIVIKIVSIRKKQVKVKIESPKEIPIFREEIYKKIIPQK